MIRWVLRRAIDKFTRERNDIRDVIDASPHAAWRYSRITGLLAAMAEFGLATTVYASGQPASVSNYTITPERIAASVAAVVGLIGAVIGGVALARSAGNGRRGAIVALVMAPIGLVIGGLVAVTAESGLGTGHGLGGGIVAMIVGLIGIVLGGLALARSRRTA